MAVDLNHIVTPCFIIDPAALTHNYNEIKSNFLQLWPNLVIGYSFKTNPTPWIIQQLKKLGAFAEVVSIDEFELAKTLGFKHDEIIVNGPVKGAPCLQESLESGAIVNLDNFSEIDWIYHNPPRSDKQWYLGLRANFDLELECPHETIVGNERSRFGFNIENGDLAKAVYRLSELPYVTITGFHGHQSTKSRSLKVFKTITSILAKLIHSLPQKSAKTYIDVGGCFFGGQNTTLTQGFPSMKEYAECISSSLREHGLAPENCQLILEPGAAIVATAVSYLCRVTDIREIASRLFITTDGSRLDVAPQHQNSLSVKHISPSLQKEAGKHQVICGYTCIEMDRLAILPEGVAALQKGDLLEISNVGGYGMSLRPDFIHYNKQHYVLLEERYDPIPGKLVSWPNEMPSLNIG